MTPEKTRALIRSLTMTILSLLVLCLLAGCGAEHDEGDGHDDHSGHDHGAVEKNADPHAVHDHGEEEKEPEPDPHAGHDHGAAAKKPDPHAGHDHGEEENKVELNAEQKRRIGLKVGAARGAKISFAATFPGETVLNEDRVVHVVPRAPGVVREVRKTLGDTVGKGEVLAMVDSPELGAAKLEFFAKASEVNCCEIELPRAQAIYANTARLLAMLEKSPSVDEIRRSKLGEMGEYRGKLVSAYAEFVVARKAYEREKVLKDKGVSSEGDFLEASGAFKKAQAGYAAARDSAAYATKVALFESARKRQLAELEAVAAEQTLYIKGLSADDVRALRALIPKLSEPGEECKCDDPNCKHGKGPVLALPKIAKDSGLAWYPLRAPFDGAIIEKHITLGERVGDDSEVFTIADLEKVWVRFSVFQKDLPHVKPGQKVRVSGGSGVGDAEGTIAYVAPVMDEKLRAARARIVLDNPDGRWRPGLFVSVRVSTGDHQAAVAVPKSAVQTVDEKTVVFVEEDGGFVPEPVKLGRSDAEHVEIVSGLKPGQRYVTDGAFELKAMIVTKSLDPHAGHGH
jgi:multidrug efflux pump subunit AcrA (membrane-fusion protein)